MSSYPNEQLHTWIIPGKLEHTVTLAKKLLWRITLYRLGVQEKFLEEQRSEEETGVSQVKSVCSQPREHQVQRKEESMTLWEAVNSGQFPSEQRRNVDVRNGGVWRGEARELTGARSKRTHTVSLDSLNFILGNGSHCREQGSVLDRFAHQKDHSG